MRRTLTPIAANDDRFVDFAPYVASINRAGTVAFSAALRTGGGGVFVADGATIELSNATSEPRSHPDIDDDGSLCVYASSAERGEVLLRVERDRTTVLADASSFARIGPLGPTMSDDGAIAFRADDHTGRSGIYLCRGGTIETVADTSRFAAFHGLPLALGAGVVVFRADVDNSEAGIYAYHDGAIDTLVRTGDRFRTLGRFPCANEEHRVVIDAISREGVAGIFGCTSDREVTTLVDATHGFESFRGALIDDAGSVFFYATSRAGRLGIYSASDPEDAIVAIGDDQFGSPIVELALNPVSINERGQLAIRLRLENQRQLIVRAEVI